MPEASASSLITTLPMGVPSASLISAVHPEAVTAMAPERITAASADSVILPLLIGFAINFILISSVYYQLFYMRRFYKRRTTLRASFYNCRKHMSRLFSTFVEYFLKPFSRARKKGA